MLETFLLQHVVRTFKKKNMASLSRVVDKNVLISHLSDVGFRELDKGGMTFTTYRCPCYICGQDDNDIVSSFHVTQGSIYPYGSICRKCRDLFEDNMTYEEMTDIIMYHVFSKLPDMVVSLSRVYDLSIKVPRSDGSVSDGTVLGVFKSSRKMQNSVDPEVYVYICAELPGGLTKSCPIKTYRTCDGKNDDVLKKILSTISESNPFWR